MSRPAVRGATLTRNATRIAHMKSELAAMTVADLDQWIAAALRERSQRKVPMPPEPEKTVEATAFPRSRAARLADGQTLLQLRHAGAGWVSFLLNVSERATLLTHLMQHALVPAEKPVPVQVTVTPSPAAPTLASPLAGDGGGGKPH